MRLLALIAPALLLFGSLIYAAATNLGLGDYLLQWGLPLLPGALNLVDIAVDNHRLVSRKQQVETGQTTCSTDSEKRHPPLCWLIAGSSRTASWKRDFCQGSRTGGTG